VLDERIEKEGNERIIHQKNICIRLKSETECSTWTVRGSGEPSAMLMPRCKKEKKRKEKHAGIFKLE
jgi:hypothetical protein